MLRPQTNAFRAVHDLSGIWSIRLDEADEGRGAGWHEGVPEATPIAVPASWNDQLVGARDNLGPAWYERRFDAPPRSESELALRFGSVHYLAEVWLNGAFLGEHEGGHLPFAFPIERLRAEDNVLVVRVDAQLA